MTSPILVGRAPELERLDDALDAAAGGNGSFVLVEGDAGIGKSRLVNEFIARAQQQVARVLAGECFPFTDTVPYAPMLSILTSIGVGAERIDIGAADSGERARLFQLVADQLASESDETPLVVVVEDVHWIDGASGDLLLFLAHGLADRRILMVATRRTDEVTRSTQFGRGLSELHRGGWADRIHVPALDDDEVAELVGAIVSDLPAPHSQRLVRRVEGNPFFIEELVAALDDDLLPRTVKLVILERIASLSEPTRAVLRCAAVIGRRFEHRLLAAAVDAPGPELDAALREAVTHSVLVPDADGYCFRHALMQEAIDDDLLPGERTSLHERIAAALSDHPELAVGGSAAAAAELARHWTVAGRSREALAAEVAAGVHAGRDPGAARGRQGLPPRAGALARGARCGSSRRCQPARGGLEGGRRCIAGGRARTRRIPRRRPPRRHRSGGRGRRLRRRPRDAVDHPLPGGRPQRAR